MERNQDCRRETLDRLGLQSDWFFERLGKTLEAYAKHAGRKTIQDRDMHLVMKRYVTSIVLFLFGYLYMPCYRFNTRFVVHRATQLLTEPQPRQRIIGEKSTPFFLANKYAPELQRAIRDPPWLFPKPKARLAITAQEQSG